MQLEELMARLKYVYNQRGGEINVRIGNGSNSRDIQDIHSNEDADFIVLY